MTLRRSSVRSLCRAGTAALIAGAAALVGAPAAVADEAPPVAYSASVNRPDDMHAGSYYGVVVEGDPFTTGGYTMTSSELDVAELNAGRHSDTGWVDDVRAASPSSTGAVAGIAMLVVAGLITVVAVVPRRRPPTER
jgi:hypothetical protein